jgi:hypothetical protein
VAGCKCVRGAVSLDCSGCCLRLRYSWKHAGCSYVCIVVALVGVEMILLANVLDPAADQWLANMWYKIHFPFHS